MSDAQNVALRQIVAGRLMPARGLLDPDAAERSRAERTRELLAQGIDPHSTLAQREVLIAQRGAAVDTGVAALDGTNVRLGGFVLPAATQGDQVTQFLLAPWIGACSRTPPRPRNQGVRVPPAQPYSMSRACEPVWAGVDQRCAAPVGAGRVGVRGWC